MPAIIEGPPAPGEDPGPWWKRAAWFVGIALAASGATVAAAYLLKALLRL